MIDHSPFLMREEEIQDYKVMLDTIYEHGLIYAQELKYNNSMFPMTMANVKKFEAMNPHLSINVLSYNEHTIPQSSGNIFKNPHVNILHRSKNNGKPINLLLLKRNDNFRYLGVTNLNRLLNHKVRLVKGEKVGIKIQSNWCHVCLRSYRKRLDYIHQTFRNEGFDDSLKNYKLYYDSHTGQHYVGCKYFDKINDLVQDGLIHLYIESRGAAELKKIAECNMYEESPFYKARYYTLQMTRQIIGNSTVQGQPNNNRNSIEGQRRKNMDDSYSHILQSKVNDTENVGLKNLNPFYSKDESKGSNNPFLNSGELIEQVESTICPPIRHSSLISSQLARQKNQNYRYLNKTFSDDESLQETSQDSISEMSSINTDRHADTSSSSSIDTRTETKNSLGESGYTVSTTDTNSLSSDASLDNQMPIDSKSEMSVQTSKSIVNQYTNCFADQEKSHNFKTHTFKGPYWCDFCTHFMWGLVAQGVKCQDCGFQAHRKCSDRVPSDCLPVMKRLKRVFGVELTSLGKVENRGVPLILLRLISLIEERGLEVEGIYRVSGNAELIEEVKADLDKDIESVDLETDVRLSELHNISSLIKLFFRQLPIPLVTLEVSSMLTDLFKSQDNQKVRLEQMKDCLLRLPLVHYSTLKYFMAHLRKLSILSDINKMTVENLAIIFAPSLISHQPIPVPGSVNLSPLEMQEIIHRTIQSSVDIVEDLIRYNDVLFVDERQI